MILTELRSTAIEDKFERSLVPSCGHFGELPKILSAAFDADSGKEAIDCLSEAFDGSIEFLKAVESSFPALLPITAKFAKLEDDVGDSDSSAKVRPNFCQIIKYSILLF